MKAVKQAARGFTLVEVLVALAIMAVMAALAWQGVDGMMRSREAGQQAIERTSRLNTIVVQWEQDLRELHDTGIVPAITFDGQTLRLTRNARGGVALVTWSLRNGRWLRWSSVPITRAGALQEAWMASQQQLGNEAGQVMLLDDVAGWQIYFFRGGGWTNPQSTGDVAANPAAAASAAVARVVTPEGVRLQITIAGQQLTRDVALQLRGAVS